MTDYDLWPIFLAGLTWLTPSQPLQQYLTLQLKDAGFTTFETNLLTIPAYTIFIINLLFLSLAERKDQSANAHMPRGASMEFARFDSTRNDQGQLK